MPANSESFGYTPCQSLTSATGPYGALAFTYDGVGNRLTAAADSGGGPVTDSYSYPALSNRLSTIALGTGGARGYSYDAMGNVTAETRPGGTYGYSYDSAGRMSGFTINGMLQASYVYDFAGRQAIRSLTAPVAATVHSVFDSEDRRVAEYDEATGALIREYVWLDWEQLAVIEGATIFYVRADHIGRPVFATNAGGAKVWSMRFDPFSTLLASTGNPIAARFPGQWFQAESGLHQNWMRDYDPTTGRYIQPDPLGLIDGSSIYGYAKQNPGRWTDPRGECPWCAAGAVVILVTILTPEPANAPGYCDKLVEPDPLAPYVNGVAAGVFFGRGYWAGAEYRFGSARVAPYGNRWFFPKRGGKWWERTYNKSNGKWPHYHSPRYGSGGKVRAGQSGSRHRPWDKNTLDRSFWDRF